MKSAVLASSVAAASASHWAVIMAGSNTYGNYRHQSDACHAYQIAKRNGIPESQIILLAYDDIANNRENPFPGKIFNKPTPAGTPGVDVYDGCKISYKGSEVTADNFIKVLSGDTSASGPVLKSTKEDRVFVYFTDHGGPGILGVPSGAGGYIHAADVNKALETLHSKGGYKELLFYLEACESGSIFNGLLKAPNAKAVTAANPTESSWGWYCGSQAMVDGKNINSCLGDEFSVRWMEDTDKANIKSETVGQQFSKIKSAVTKSHVQEYGVTSFDSEPIGDFEGNTGALFLGKQTGWEASGNGIDQRQIEIKQAYDKIMNAKTQSARKIAEVELSAILARRQAADDKFGAIASLAVGGDAAKAEDMLEGPVEQLLDAECHRSAMETAAKKCGRFDDYSMRYARLFANLCNSKIDLTKLEKAIDEACSQVVV